MLKIPRVDTFLGFNLKISLLIFQHVGILIDIGSMIEFMIEVSASIELVAILFVFELLPLLTTISSIYGIIKNKPKFLLPELIMGILCAWISVIVTLLYPMAATGLIEYAALRGKSLDMYGLFGLWIIIGIVTGFVVYYTIALYSLYMLMTEDALFAHGIHRNNDNIEFQEQTLHKENKNTLDLV